MESRNIFKRFDEVVEKECKHEYNSFECSGCTGHCITGSIFLLDDEPLSENELDTYMIVWENNQERQSELCMNNIRADCTKCAHINSCAEIGVMHLEENKQ